MPQTVFDEDGEVLLWSADPDCEHDIQPRNWSGVRCTKCGGWFCY